MWRIWPPHVGPGPNRVTGTDAAPWASIRSRRRTLSPGVPTKVMVIVPPLGTGPPVGALVRVPPVSETVKFDASLSGSVTLMLTVVLSGPQAMLIDVQVADGGAPGMTTSGAGPG